MATCCSLFEGRYHLPNVPKPSPRHPSCLQRKSVVELERSTFMFSRFNVIASHPPSQCYRRPPKVLTMSSMLRKHAGCYSAFEDRLRAFLSFERFPVFGTSPTTPSCIQHDHIVELWRVFHFSCFNVIAPHPPSQGPTRCTQVRQTC